MGWMGLYSLYTPLLWAPLVWTRRANSSSNMFSWIHFNLKLWNKWLTNSELPQPATDTANFASIRGFLENVMQLPLSGCWDDPVAWWEDHRRGWREIINTKEIFSLEIGEDSVVSFLSSLHLSRFPKWKQVWLVWKLSQIRRWQLGKNIFTVTTIETLLKLEYYLVHHQKYCESHI